MRFNKNIVSLLVFSTSIFSLMTAPVVAQDIEEVIVTATKIKKNIQDIGASVFVIKGDQLSQFDGAEDITQNLSGVQAAGANGSRVAFQIRGIGAVDHQALTPTAAAVYIDGVYMASNVQTSPLLFDLERVEVLKGPQGSLYGRNASAGAINFISIRPDDKQSGYAEAGYGRFNRLNFKGAINMPLNDRVSFRLAGRYLSQDPVIKNVVTNDAIAAPSDGGGKRDEFGLRASAKISVSPDTEILITNHYMEDNGISTAPRNSSFDTPELTLGKHEISIDPDGIRETDNEFYGSSVEVNHSFGDFSLVMLGAYESYNQQHGFDFDGSPAPFGLSSLNANLAYDRNFEQFSLETRLNYSNENLELMVGVYADSEDFNQEYLIWCGELDEATLIGSCTYVGAPGRVGSTPPTTATVSSLQSLIEQTRRTAALFTHNTITLTPRLDVVVGARITHEKIKGNGEGRHIFNDGVVALNNRDDLGLAIGSNEISENRLTGNFGLNYSVTDQAMAYVSYANGFKSGGFNGEVINNATHFSDEGLFEAETVHAIEAGFKVSQEGLRYNVAVFFQDYNKPQARIFVPFNLENGGSFTSNSLSNLEEASSYGAEFDFVWSPLVGLELMGSFTYLDTEIKQTLNPDVPQNAETFDGNPLPFASKYSSTLSARYQWPINDDIQASIGVNGKYQSTFYLDAEGLDDRKQKGFGVIDATASLHFDQGLTLMIWGKNLGNAFYAASGFGFIGYNKYIAPPRTFGASLRYDF